MATRHSLVEAIERKTKRSVTIDTTLSDKTLVVCDPQTGSPLYCKLPKELRDYVFQLSCTQSPDDRHPFGPNQYYYRPGHTARLRTYTALLTTCRRAWLEANTLPMRQAEHAFWFQRGPYDRHPDHAWRANVRNERDRYARFLKSLTTQGLRSVAHIRLFMQMFQFEQLTQPAQLADYFPLSLVEKGYRPTRFTVTVRSTDWWNWERGRALSLPLHWVQAMLDSPFLGGVEKFMLELETEERRRDQLDVLIQQIATLRGKPRLVDLMGRDRSTACSFVLQGPPTTSCWTRSPNIDDKAHDVYQGMTALPLCVKTLVWGNRPCDMPAPAPQPVFARSFGRLGEMLGDPSESPIRIRSPAMILRSRSQRDRLRSGGWLAGRFPEKEDEMWTSAVRQAVRWEQGERERYEKMVGDIEAERLLAKWEKQGSLLSFVGKEG